MRKESLIKKVEELMRKMFEEIARNHVSKFDVTDDFEEGRVIIRIDNFGDYVSSYIHIGVQTDDCSYDFIKQTNIDYVSTTISEYGLGWGDEKILKLIWKAWTGE